MAQALPETKGPAERVKARTIINATPYEFSLMNMEKPPLADATPGPLKRSSVAVLTQVLFKVV